MAEAKLTGLLSALSGRLGNFVFRDTKNGTVVADRPRRSEVVASAAQILVKVFLTNSSKEWGDLSDAQREAWGAYARAYFPRDKDGTGAGPSGFAVFTKAAFYQQAAGLALPSAAPTVAPPAGASSLTLVPVDDEQVVTLRVAHPIVAVAGHRLFVELTAPITSPARRVQESDFRAAAGLNAASLPPLQASNADYVLGGLRFVYPEGSRFGARVRVISPLGVPGPVLSQTLVQVFV
jgi:hypothetical protein